MLFLYFYRVPLPDPRADAVQIMNTCAGMARAGADVALHVETARASAGETLRFYGIQPPSAGEGPGRLTLHAVGRRWSWPLFRWRTAAPLASAAAGPACLFVREVRPYVPGLMRRARAAGIPALFEAHNVSSSLVREKQDKGEGGARLARKAAQRAALEEEILASADGLVCTQRATLEALRPLLRSGLPATVLGNGTQLPTARGRDAGGTPIDVLYCGSLKPWKGVDTLVSALPAFAPHRLTIVGPATPEDLRRVAAAAAASGAAARLEILPAVPPSEVWPLYARARVGVIPLPGRGSIEARQFTSPLKLFEMMASGLPIVASRLPSLEEYLTDEREALLVPPDDPQALGAAVARLLRDEGLRLALGSAGRARAAEFSWDARGSKLVAFAGQLRAPGSRSR
ncbi:MAG TPA: glycosyltransferase family 4 protein [Candidatus Polarisedimenticolia bacterium]|nr:glycosyltransferase family 4 protein [Candidatus Polarisedimenticolia bacterium]